MPTPNPQPPIPLAGARALVVGMAKSGMASAELLLKHGAGVRATYLQMDREAEKRLKELQVPFQLQSPEVFENADLIVLSPGVPADLEPLKNARRRGATVIGEVELASYFLQGPIMGITGSNGKTTTTALAGHILRESKIAVQVGGISGRQ